MVPVADFEEIDSSDNCPPVTGQTPESCPGTPESQVASISDTIYYRFFFLWTNIIARLRILVEFVFFWPRIVLIEIPRLAICSAVLGITVSWLSVSLAFNVVLDLLKTVTAWIILACYLCAFSLQATWITLKNVAVARRGQLTIREVLDSICGNRALEASS